MTLTRFQRKIRASSKVRTKYSVFLMSRYLTFLHSPTNYLLILRLSDIGYITSQKKFPSNPLPRHCRECSRPFRMETETTFHLSKRSKPFPVASSQHNVIFDSLNLKLTTKYPPYRDIYTRIRRYDFFFLPDCLPKEAQRPRSSAEYPPA